MSEQESSKPDDAFMTVPRHPAGGRTRRSGITFGDKQASFYAPPDTDLSHLLSADWQHDGNGTLRLRCYRDRRGNISFKGNARSQGIPLSSGALYDHIGRKLHGFYPFTRTDADDFYLDISEAQSEAEGPR